MRAELEEIKNQLSFGKRESITKKALVAKVVNSRRLIDKLLASLENKATK